MARTLLVVDDIKSNREILKRILNGEYSILEATDGVEALRIMKEIGGNLSAVLLDLVMPVMDGFEALKRISADSELSQIPIIVMTGQSDTETEEKVLSLGAKDYISKPYQSAIIKQRIKNTISLRESAATVNAMICDRLTGLYSRSAFFEKAAAMLSSHEAGYYIMACFDVDRFKLINDRYGSPMGDEVLKYIARVFGDGFGAHGGICARIAADDFAVLYPTSFKDSDEISEIRDKAALVNGLVAPVTFSIGRYIASDLTLSPSAMYDRAVLAANSVKGQYDFHIAVYEESMREKLLLEQEIIGEMQEALEKHQFEVWFQPQYNHSTGALIGAEALVRWRHPKKGLIPPGLFIPVFEQNGFVFSLDKYVWEETLRYLRAELDAGRAPLPVSVNISRHDILHEELCDTIKSLVGRYDIPVELLRLEITESAFAESTERIVAAVKALIAYGFTLEIDDFGSGYSSLNTLKSVPAQVVKLDMRFLEEDGDSRRGGNIVESVVRMTKWLGMSVIAEGVETKEQADYLLSIGCNYIQGYFYAKPMPLSKYQELCSGNGFSSETSLLTLETVDNLDNNSFWDPKSLDTLIFNSYVGAACILELHNEKIELIRMTEKYNQLLTEAGISPEDAMRLDWGAHLNSDSRKKLEDDIRHSLTTKKEVIGEYIFTSLPGCPQKIHLRSTLRVIAATEDRALVYCICENITPQRNAEQKERELANKLKAVLDNVNCGITATAIEGETVEFLLTNQKYFDILGYSEAQYHEEIGSEAFGTIYASDRPLVIDIITALKNSGKAKTVEYRAVRRDKKIIWLRSILSLTRFEGSERSIFLSTYTDITEEKLSYIATRELAESDPLTGVLNRTAFVKKVNEAIISAKPGSHGALLMLDVDGFKQINDVFGHQTGDNILVEISHSLRECLGKYDYIGRLGGDEFLVYLPEISGEAEIVGKAKQICAISRKAISAEVEISGSIGIALAPRDGRDFDALYKKADAALYHVKGSGKDGYAFFHEEMADEHFELDSQKEPDTKKKRRILIVDDNRIDHALLSNIFADDFIVEKAKDGISALIRLRHYGSAVSVVLLDLMMPGIDGFEVLERMQESKELRTIPVIVVSGDGSRETSLRAIRAGAVDYVTKPVDPDILRIRVQSAISKSENEKLRAKNSLLEYQNSEVQKYKTVLERSGTVVIEHDWINNSFVYDASISSHIAGVYDDRKLWHILLSDFVADTATVKTMQELVLEAAQNRKSTDDSLFVRLKTPSSEIHWFKMCIYKTVNEFGLTGKIYLSFSDHGIHKGDE